MSQNFLRPEPGPRQYLLLTGGTGLVGQYLIKDLMATDVRLAVIVRPARKFSAVQRIEAIMQRWEKELATQLPRPVVLEGNINDDMLGLDDESQRWVAENCHSIIHNAAILKFAGATRQDEPWKSNCGGTENVLNFCAATSIRHLHYVSTAYVCGVRDSPVKEDELNVGQSFRNDYECSKFEAETMVRAAKHFDTKTIYRPAVIVGDSRNGFTSTYHGMFLYLRLLSTLIPLQKQDENGVYQTPIDLPMTGDEPRNLVPVDWVSSVIAHLVKTPAAHDRTFHLVPDEFSTTRTFIDACCEYFNSGGVRYASPSANEATPSTNPVAEHGQTQFSEMFFQNARIYRDYEMSDPEFDKTNLKKYAGHIDCPPMDAETIHRFIEFGTEDRWGRLKPKPVMVERCFHKESSSLVALLERLFPNHPVPDSTSNAHNEPVVVGLNVLGEGGGQWTVYGMRGGMFDCQLGLPQEGQPTLTIDSKRLVQLLRELDARCDEESANVYWNDMARKFGDAFPLAALPVQ